MYFVFKLCLIFLLARTHKRTRSNTERRVLAGNEGSMFSKFFINDKRSVFSGVSALFTTIQSA